MKAQNILVPSGAVARSIQRFLQIDGSLVTEQTRDVFVVRADHNHGTKMLSGALALVPKHEAMSRMISMPSAKHF